ncbi:hypothetical protein C478_12325 [Natrinema thermotolerans DSM 11552]|uniref:hypothetical protein n=1 Tax=Natrinema sp. H-ect1 TaxID=3242700 RepID=UPI0002B0F89C|nr:hypothetical protein C478_12325 [Natrinema thermotolerans DSM 11552]
MLHQEGKLEINPDGRLVREAEETAQRVMRGGKIGVHRMRTSDVYVQRLPGEELVSKAKDLADTGTEKIDESTTKSYRLTKDQLVDMVQSVETPKGLTEYIEHHDIDVASRVQDAASSPVKGATKGWTAGSMLGPSPGQPVLWPVDSLACQWGRSSRLSSVNRQPGKYRRSHVKYSDSIPTKSSTPVMNGLARVTVRTVFPQLRR